MAIRTASTDPRAFALESLAASVADSSAKVLFGTKTVPGFFNGNNAKTRAASEYCVQQNWLQDTGEKVGSGSRAKSLYRITPAGIQAVLDNNPVIGVLHALTNAVEKQKEKLDAVAANMATMKNDADRFAAVLANTLENVKPPDVASILSGRDGGSAAPGQRHSDLREQWQEEIVRQADGAGEFGRLEIPKLYEDMKKEYPSLTVGQFHDGLRRLADQKRIRLLPFTRSYAAIAEHRSPLFLDGEVIYYVRGK